MRTNTEETHLYFNNILCDSFSEITLPHRAKTWIKKKANAIIFFIGCMVCLGPCSKVQYVLVISHNSSNIEHCGAQYESLVNV